MLDSLIRFSLQNRLLVVAGAALMIVYGTMTARLLPVDVFPDITRPTVTIITESHGMAPEEVEVRVTAPIESYLNGLPGMDRIRSQSGIGLSVIYVEFDWGTDTYKNRQLVQEKLNLALQKLPADITPTLGPIGSLMGQIQQIAVTSKNPEFDPLELRNFAEWVLRPRLMTIPGVSQVISIGGGLAQFQILISAKKLNQYQISLEQLDQQLTKISQNTTGGFFEKDGQEFLVRNMGVVDSIDDIKKTFVGLHFGRPILIEDIAEVQRAARLKRGDGSFNQQPSVVMTIQKQPGADTIQISKEIDLAIEQLQVSMPKDLIINPDVFKQATFIEASIRGIQSKLKYGTVLVFIVLLLFLANLRMSLITLTAIPVSFIITFLVFKIFDLTVNTMTLGGLAIAIGELVDDSIVDVENIHRRLNEGSKKSFLKIIFEASSEVRNSIVLATLIIALVFLPLFSLTGLEGSLFAPLGVAYLTALFASLLVSLTLTPVLCSYFLKSTLDKKSETSVVLFLKKWDRKVLQWALPRSQLVLGIGLALFVAAIGLIPFMGQDFLPKFNEETAMIAVIAPPGMSLTESNKIGNQVEGLLLKIPEIKSVSRRTGRAEMDEHAAGVNVSEIDVDFKSSGRPREVVLNDVRTQLKTQYPELGINIGQPISHLIDHMLSGVNAMIAIKIFGPDLTTLRQKSVELKNIIQETEGLVDLRIEQQGLVPQLKIQVLRDEAARVGLSPGEITELLEGAFNGKTVAQVTRGTQFVDVYYQFDDDSRGAQEKMESTVLKVMPNGKRVLLQDVADVYETSGPNEINRENNQRRIVISANVSGRDLGSTVKELQKRIKKIKFAEGYYVIFDGQFENQKSATRHLLLYSILSLFGIFIILFSHFRSVTITTQIMATIPLAFVGGLFSLFATEGTITVASLVGFITLCGMAARNGIMMISHYLHLMKFEGEVFSVEMIIRGSQERLVPVLMTASVAALALLPLVFAKGQPGSEILHPVAVVIVGGLLSSTLLDLILTPTLFYRIGKKSAEKYLNQNSGDEL